MRQLSLQRLDKMKLGDLFDDRSITNALQSNLAADPELAGKIKVDTIERVVYLTGTVETDELKERATEIALKTPRVSKVANNIIVQSSN
ncbi:MAG: BON domain-containing protein [Candidatus Binatia bacterium]